MTSSLFLKVKNENPEAFEKVVKNIYTDIAKELGNVPIEVANDGDVTALAGAIDLKDNSPLVSGSWKYKYAIFDMIFIYKTFDWESYLMVVYGG